MFAPTKDHKINFRFSLFDIPLNIGSDQAVFSTEITSLWSVTDRRWNNQGPWDGMRPWV